jgi:hypothetical protein
MANIPGYMVSEKALRGDVALREAGRAEGKVKAAERTVAKAEAKAELTETPDSDYKDKRAKETHRWMKLRPNEPF